MPDSASLAPLAANPTRPQPAGVGLFALLASQDPEATARTQERHRLSHLASQRGQVLEAVNRAHPEWTLDDWDQFYRENGDAFHDQVDPAAQRVVDDFLGG